MNLGWMGYLAAQVAQMTQIHERPERSGEEICGRFRGGPYAHREPTTEALHPKMSGNEAGSMAKYAEEAATRAARPTAPTVPGEPQ